MITFHGFRASIRVGGKDLPQSDIQYNRVECTATCWIPSEAGKAYTIYAAREEVLNEVTPRTAISMGIYLDGKMSHRVDNVTFEAECEETEVLAFTRGNKEWDPTFYELEPIDDEDEDISAPPEPGLIILKLQRVQIRPATRCDNPKSFEMSSKIKHSLQKHSLAHESRFKAGRHATT
ncbi:hypothetical protein FRB95_011746 [Tulasnella sp. JGI-2019a]|nr:hypothetical protein FRB95_011746 [Tulasnella sp. JGI-2019a]